MSWSLSFRARRYVRESLWVIPLAGGVGGWLAGIAASDLGSVYELTARWDYSAGTAEVVLSAIIAASVSLTGFVVTVSVLIVQMATGTFSARYMRIFYRDRLFKLTLAALVASFSLAYTLLRQVETDSVPNVGVTLSGSVLGAGLILFVIFLDRSIHHLRPVAVAALVAGAGRRALRDVLRDAHGPDAPAIVAASFEAGGEPVLVVSAAHAGAIQAVDTRGLARWARANECLVVLLHPVGDFVPAGAALIEVHSAAAVPVDAERHLRASISLGIERTIEQDPAFAIRILVDIAIRALSPAVNDPTTAIQVLDYLEDLLRQLGTADLAERATRNDRPLDVGVTIPVRSWDDYLALAVTEIRQYGAHSIQVTRRLRALLDELESSVPPRRRPAVARELARHETSVAETWGRTVDVDLASLADRQGIGGPSGKADPE